MQDYQELISKKVVTAKKAGLTLTQKPFTHHYLTTSGTLLHGTLRVEAGLFLPALDLARPVSILKQTAQLLSAKAVRLCLLPRSEFARSLQKKMALPLV